MISEKQKQRVRARRKGDPFQHVLDCGYQQQITKLSSPNITLNGVQKGQDFVAYNFEPVNK